MQAITERGAPMAAEVGAFVTNWVSENINPEAFLDEEGEDSRPDEYARQCEADAEADGRLTWPSTTPQDTVAFENSSPPP